ncbi:MAG: hypothetical protein WC533_02020 [Candidatus Pacearchaeota archaeon]
MVKKAGGLASFLVLSLFLVSLANASTFFIEQPKEIYSIGDVMNLVLGTDGEEGWVDLKMVCGNSTKLLYYNYLTKDTTAYYISAPLTREFLRDMDGACHILIVANDGEKNSLDFEITGQIFFTLQFNAESFNPNETLIFTGTAKKTNEQKINGFAEIKFSSNGLEMIVPVTDNKFSGNISLPENIASGEYQLNIFIYEKDSFGEVTNFGVSNSTITINSLPTKLELSVPSSIKPGENLEFTSILYDQADYNINGKTASYIITSADGRETFNIIGNTGESSYQSFEENAVLGYWNISAESEGISTKTQFYVSENKKISFIIVNDTITLLNVGNVPYDKFVEITIGNYTEVKELNLSVGNSIKYVLSAPDGEYNISVGDGETFHHGTVALTGNSISISKNRKPGSFGEVVNRNSFAWLILIVIFGMFILLTSRKVIKHKFPYGISKFSAFGGNIPFSEDKKGGVIKLASPKEEKIIKPVFETLGNEAKHSSVVDGEKQNSGIIAIKIKNYHEVINSKTNANENLKKAINKISENDGKVYDTGEYVVGIFAPIATRSLQNSFSAIKTARAVAESLRIHNSKYAQKIDFGIGVNEGEIVAKKQSGKLIFTPLGNVLISTKRIADIADNTILVGEQARKSSMNLVKMSPNPDKSSIKTFIVGEILDSSENKKFISSFLERNKEYKQLRDFRAGK